jgi:CubicO group peptidase (beta-lactamase class C family)
MTLSVYTDAVCEAVSLVPDFSGVVSVGHGGELVHAHAAGMADRAESRRVDTDTRFGIASGTKLFTALGIMRLVERGRLELDSRVVDLLPGAFSRMDHAVTIRHLLTHTSGFSDYYNEDDNPDSEAFFVDIPWYRLETPSDYLPLMEDYSMRSSPGGPFVYNNGGFVILGAVIESVSGETYRDFVEREVLARAGMGRSGFFAFNRLPVNTAFGYIDGIDGSWRTNIYNLPIRGGGDGGMYTTARDLARFWHAFVTGGIVGSDLTRQMLTPHARINEHTEYGLGVYLDATGSAYFIVGGDAGVGFESRYFANDEVVVSIVSNTTAGEEGMAEKVKRCIARRGGRR